MEHKAPCDATPITPVLAFHNVNKSTVVSADASSYGSGDVFLKKHGDQLRPVEFVSHTLKNAEKRYAQVEKDCLASVSACEKISRYLCRLESFRLFISH